MGKFNKHQDKKQKHSNHHDNPARSKPGVSRRQFSQQLPKNSKKKLATATKGNGDSDGQNQQRRQQTKVNVPFTKDDRVLLVGEGDFSFTLSLAQNYKVASIVATCFDKQESLRDKYPDIQKTLTKLVQHKNLSGKDADGSHTQFGSGQENTEWEGFSSDSVDDNVADSDTNHATKRLLTQRVSILYGIDATKLSTAHKKALKAHGPYTKIVFNFPHVGGLSTDVNRQVRANQELLVGFFKAAKPLLATQSNPVKPLSTLPKTEDAVTNTNIDDKDDDSEPEAEEEDEDPYDPTPPAPPPSTILLTLFTSHPYTLWNPRDLARHCDLRVIESFRFPWTAYPDYRHARTAGDITHGKDRSEQGKRLGAWRGEEREARCFVLGLKDDNGAGGHRLGGDSDEELKGRGQMKRKRKGGGHEDSGSE